MKSVRTLVFSALCAAMGIALPLAFHAIPNAGAVMLPMHIPVLLCGLVCGPWYGAACGLLTPALSCLITGMPPVAMLPGMLCELAVYGLVSGLMINSVRTKHKAVNVYISLICAMLTGRVAYGLLNALIFKAGAYSMPVWLSAAFVTALPGIITQLLLLPPVAIALDKAKLISLPKLKRKAENESP